MSLVGHTKSSYGQVRRSVLYGMVSFLLNAANYPLLIRSRLQREFGPRPDLTSAVEKDLEEAMLTPRLAAVTVKA